MKGYYLFGSRVITHFVFWGMYFLLFGFIWAEDGNYLSSYFLEFILLPVRILAVYFSIYLLIPKYLENKKFGAFITGYAALLLLCGLLQRAFTFFFYEGFFESDASKLFDWPLILRAIILINSTALLVSAVKIGLLWLLEKEKNNALIKEMRSSGYEIVEIKAEKRTYRVEAKDILFIEGMGNYVTFVLKERKIISYISLKEALNILPERFLRIHKSFIVNKDHILSYNYEDVQLGERFLPIGRSFKTALKM